MRGLPKIIQPWWGWWGMALPLTIGTALGTKHRLELHEAPALWATSVRVPEMLTGTANRQPPLRFFLGNGRFSAHDCRRLAYCRPRCRRRHCQNRGKRFLNRWAVFFAQFCERLCFDFQPLAVNDPARDHVLEISSGAVRRLLAHLFDSQSHGAAGSQAGSGNPFGCGLSGSLMSGAYPSTHEYLATPTYPSPITDCFGLSPME